VIRPPSSCSRPATTLPAHLPLLSHDYPPFPPPPLHPLVPAPSPHPHSYRALLLSPGPASPLNYPLDSRPRPPPPPPSPPFPPVSPSAVFSPFPGTTLAEHLIGPPLPHLNPTNTPSSHASSILHTPPSLSDGSAPAPAQAYPAHPLLLHPPPHFSSSCSYPTIQHILPSECIIRLYRGPSRPLSVSRLPGQCVGQRGPDWRLL
jgi:hypothetical protein